jgi:hypothetical protein
MMQICPDVTSGSFCVTLMLAAIYGGAEVSQDDPLWRDLILFNEYYQGDSGAGLVAKPIQQSGAG